MTERPRSIADVIRQAIAAGEVPEMPDEPLTLPHPDPRIATLAAALVQAANAVGAAPEPAEADEIAARMHNEIEFMIDVEGARRQQVAVRRVREGVVLSPAPEQTEITLPEAIDRLQAAALAGTEYRWRKAWHEAPQGLVALLIAIAGGFEAFGRLSAGHAFPPAAAILPLLPDARRATSKGGRPSRWARDLVAAELIRAFGTLTGKPIAEPSGTARDRGDAPLLVFLGAVERALGAIYPNASSLALAASSRTLRAAVQNAKIGRF